MANESQKKLMARNKKYSRIWVGISFFFASISAFVIFYIFRNEPKRQNVSTFWAGFFVTIIGNFFMFRSIRIYRDEEKHQFYTKGDLAGKNGSIITDLIGIGCLVMFIGIWWEYASWFLVLVPIFIIYTLLRKLSAWLKY